MSEHPKWLGKQESAELEYKSFEALKHPESIVRAAVAMLNQRGGHVVVGVDDLGRPESAGHRNSERERDRLQSLLVDSIEPRPLDRIEVDCVHVDGIEVIEVSVRGRRAKDADAVYAERHRGMYGFWLRVGATTRALTIEEVRQRWLPRRSPSVLRRWDEPLATSRAAEIAFVVQAQTLEETPLDREGLERVLSDDQRQSLHRRKMGWAIVDEYDRIERTKRTLQLGSKGARKWLAFDPKAGTIRFEARADFLRWKPHPVFKERVIYPFPLVEGTASFFWLLSRYAEEARSEGAIRCELGIWCPEGWRLGPHRPGTIAWETPHLWQAPHDDTNIERTDDLDWENIRRAPDRSAYPFVAEVYEDFGYDRTAIPFWNESEQRFVFE